MVGRVTMMIVLRVSPRCGDGYRLVARKNGDRVRPWSRNATDYTDHFTGIAASVGTLSADSATLDGEAVVFHLDGRSNFAALRSRDGGVRAVLVVFDLMSVGMRICAVLPWRNVAFLFRRCSSILMPASESSSAGDRGRRRDHLPPCLRSRPRRDRLEAPRLTLPVGPFVGLAEDEEPGLHPCCRERLTTDYEAGQPIW